MTETMKARLTRQLKKSGNMTWKQARHAMSSSSHFAESDAYLLNLSIKAALGEGWLAYIELPNGDGFLSLVL